MAWSILAGTVELVALHVAFRKPQPRTLLLVLALALIAFEIIYLVAVNAMLRTGSLPRWANAATPKNLHLEIGPAWSVWPGRVHAEWVELRFQDRNLQFQVSLENATVDVSLWKLPAKVVHLTRVRGDNTRYLFRHKVESPKGLEKRLAGYPKIEGFADPPVFTEARKPPLSDEEYDLWTVQLGDVDVAVSELWFLEYRWSGKGRATGGFRLQPERDAQTERCVLTLDEGTLKAGPYTFANNFVGRLTAQLDRHDPRKVQGEQIFSKISLETDLKGDMPDLNFSALYLTNDEGEAVAAGGTLVLKTAFEHGAWKEGSEISYETGIATLRAKKTIVAGPMNWRARITRGGRDSRVEVSLDSPRLVLTYMNVPSKVKDPKLRAVHVALGATADLTQQLRWTSASAKLQGDMPMLSWLAYPLEKSTIFTGGSAEGSAKLQWEEGKLAAADIDVQLQRAAFEVREQATEISGRVQLEGTFDSGNERGQLDKGQIDLPELGVSGEPIPGGLHVRSERLQWHGLPPTKYDGTLKVTGETLAPLVKYLISSDLLRALAKAFVHLGKTDMKVEVARTPAAFELRVPEAKSGDVEAFGEFRSETSQPHPCGRWYVQDGSISVGVTLEGGESSIKPLVPASWWRERPVLARCPPPAAAATPPTQPVRGGAR